MDAASSGSKRELKGQATMTFTKVIRRNISNYTDYIGKGIITKAVCMSRFYSDYATTPVTVDVHVGTAVTFSLKEYRYSIKVCTCLRIEYSAYGDTYHYDYDMTDTTLEQAAKKLHISQ